jgi:thioredoxin 1
MNTALIIIGAIIVGFIVLLWFSMRKIKQTPMVDDHENVIILTDKNFQHQTKNKVVLVDFWASWCAPCRIMAPVLNDVASELTGNAHVGKVNIEQYQSLAQRFNVRSIPTLILFKNGVEVNRFVGVKTKEFLLKHLEK